MKFHEENLTRRLCVGVAVQRRHDEAGQRVPAQARFEGFHKPYIYGASKVSLRPVTH